LAASSCSTCRRQPAASSRRYPISRGRIGRAGTFVGDDDTDEIVFAQAPSHWLTVRVDLDRSSRAQYFLQQQSM
jgi:hypothetical protein